MSMPTVAIIVPVRTGLFFNGAMLDKMTNDPFVMPEPPIPPIARPRIRTIEFGATVQIREPSSNIRTADK